MSKKKKRRSPAAKPGVSRPGGGKAPGGAKPAGAAKTPAKAGGAPRGGKPHVPAYVRSQPARKRNPAFWWLVGVAVVAAVAITWFLLSQRGGQPNPAESPSSSATLPPIGPLPTAPAGTTWLQQVSLDGQAVVFGSPDAPVEVETYFDFMCPLCGQFEAANGADLEAMVNSGLIQLKTYPISFLDDVSEGTQYSTRSANAWLEVAANAPEAAFAFLQELFASQPEEYTEGLTDGQIADLATAVGVPAAVSADFAGRAYGDWLTEAYHQAMEVRQIGGTPRVFIDGEQLGGNIYTAGVLKDAVEAAARG